MWKADNRGSRDKWQITKWRDWCSKVLSSFAVKGSGPKRLCKGTIEWREVICLFS